MTLTPLLHPHVHSHPTLESAVWFLHLRWVAVAGQLLTMAVVVWVLNIKLPESGMLALMGVTAITNFGYSFWLQHLRKSGLQPADRLPTYQVVSSLMLIDLAVLTGMLYFTGGLTNPFALFYFVNIAVAGAILTPAWAWTVWFVTVLSVTSLLLRSQLLVELNNSNLQADGVWTLAKLGYIVSFATCGGVITYFVTVLTGELKQRELALKEAEDARVRNRQLEALATLAGGAAHELASPLSTIAVVAKELSRSLEKNGARENDKKDVSLIRSELDRCRQILDRMTSAAGEAAGERLDAITLDRFLEETLLGLREPQRVKVTVAEAAKTKKNLLPLQATAQAIRNLVQNALDASQPGEGIVVRADLVDSNWRILVIDRGDGMTPEVLTRVGEPFFTTKEPGRGMGLGLYLTQNVLRRLNGELKFTSRPGQGTTAEILLPTSRQ
jgi:two-component system, sensor histidine kinase RegB